MRQQHLRKESSNRKHTYHQVLAKFVKELDFLPQLCGEEVKLGQHDTEGGNGLQDGPFL